MKKSATENQSHKPSNAVLRAVKSAFANAPLRNPNGTKGIKVHFIDKGAVPHTDNLDPIWTKFDALMDPLVSPGERKICHRMLNAHGILGDSTSGISRGIGASDFIESLGEWNSNPGTMKERAGTIMHELGHNLGLRHGNVDDENHKPNHLSVMSYHWQFAWPRKNGNPKLDYERFKLKNLNEANLNEANGLSLFGGNDGPIAKYAVRWFFNGRGKQKGTKAHKRIDWNVSGDPADNHVTADINGSGGMSVLETGRSEWKSLIFDGGNIGAGAPEDKIDMVTSEDSLDELTYEEYIEMKENMIEIR